jgi:hypothetical protein
MDAHVTWPELRFPPINLWVMPAWTQGGKMTAQPHRIAYLHRAITTHRRLLAIRGG